MIASDEIADAYADGRLSRRVALAFILLFWTAQFSILTLQRYYAVGMFLPRLMLPRMVVTLVAILYSIAVAEGLRRLSPRALGARLAAGFGGALLGCLVHAVCNYWIFAWMVPGVAALPLTAETYAPPLLQWFWSYFALVGTLLAIGHSLALRDQEQCMSVLQRASHAAQLRSLRLQLNPHFMFNTLNSINALIGRERLRDAEAMVENLSDFLRLSLEAAPEEQVTFAREIELQRHYLDVESIRFADRFSVVYEIDDAAHGALVPALITQPLVENVIRHAVTRTLEPVVLTISAGRDGEWLRIAIINSAWRSSGKKGRAGTGLGIRNVALRLRGHYGHAFGFEAGRAADGGFAVRLALPFATEG
ncbi:MAG: histidine kinase [Alphaproteobacteria bacterium]|nr:histidine kinase [Alphaproteobacteria bacterium]